MALEMEIMFSEGDNAIDWDSWQKNVWCYAPKLGLVFKKGLKVLGLYSGHIKPTSPVNTSIPIPTPISNDDTTQSVDHAKSGNGDDAITSQDEFGLRHKKAKEYKKGQSYLWRSSYQWLHRGKRCIEGM